MPPLTIAQLLQKTFNKIDRLDANLLLAHVLKKPREFVVAHPEHSVNPIKSKIFAQLIKKRSVGAPLAYLTGHKEFFGFDFLVNKHVLVPRPETETMVECVIDEITTHDSRSTTQIVMIDVGTGSGCIPIAIANALKHTNTQTLKQIYAIDISQKALMVAQKNAKKHRIKIKFLHGNLLEPIIKNLILKIENLVITANLPYLTQKQFDSEPSIQHEPKHALVADNNGLALYEELLQQLAQSHLPLATCHIFLEIDPSQSKPIVKLIKKYFPKSKIKIKKDLSGLDRVASFWLDKSQK